MSSTIESLTVPGSEELIRPRMVMTAILSVVPRAPRCSRISRKRGIGSASRIPPTRSNAATINTRLKNKLAQSATNKKMLRQPSLRFAAMTGRNCRRTAARTRAFRVGASHEFRSARASGMLASASSPSQTFRMCSGSPWDPRRKKRLFRRRCQTSTPDACATRIRNAPRPDPL